VTLGHLLGFAGFVADVWLVVSIGRSRRDRL
jgi:hypothetical protein